MKDMESKLQLMREYFRENEEVLMAFLFGSHAKGLATSESDLDIAVYFKPGQETDGRREGNIWSDLTEILEKEVDLVCLNNAPASLVSEAVKNGLPLKIKDQGLYWETYLRASLEADDFSRFAYEYYNIYQQATSLTPEQKTRLLVRLQFLDAEFKEIDEFRKLTFQQYRNEKAQRRNIERWAENIINASIDIAKIILASEKKAMPRTYEEALRDFGDMSGLTGEESRKFSRFANMRNILAREYLDILYERIENFIKESPPLYNKIFNFLKKYLKSTQRSV